jgi:hypothetical protein
MIEFALTVGLLMLLIVLTAQVAIFLHYRGSLDTEAREDAFEAALVGHTPADGSRSTMDLWAKLEPGGGAIQVDARRQGQPDRGGRERQRPVPVPPFRALPTRAHAVHTVEQFQPGATTP